MVGWGCDLYGGEYGAAFEYVSLLCIFVGCWASLTDCRFISLGLYGVLYMFIARRMWIFAAALFVLQYVAYTIYAVLKGIPAPTSLALGIAPTPSLLNLFLLGLVSGSLSFGGAYTAIPFVQVEAVLKGAWLSQQVFVDCIAISNMLPAPVVIFATFVGFQGGLVDGGLGNGFAGAVVITVGMFAPCFVFTILGHSLLERLVHNKMLTSFFEGLSGAVIGVIAVTAIQILKSSIEGPTENFDVQPVQKALQKAAESGIAAVLFSVALAILYKYQSKWITIVLIVCAAVSGQFLFLDT